MNTCQHPVPPVQGRLWKAPASSPGVQHVSRGRDRLLSVYNELSIETRAENHKGGRGCIPWPPLQDLLRPCQGARLQGV